MHILETKEVPDLRESISALNDRQVSIDNHLVSVPVALRKITRDLTDIRDQLQSESARMNSESVKREKAQKE